MSRKSSGPGAGGRYRSILVPLDGSRLSERALPLALAIAERARAKLRLVLVHQLPAVPLSAEGRQLYVFPRARAPGSYGSDPRNALGPADTFWFALPTANPRRT